MRAVVTAFFGWVSGCSAKSRAFRGWADRGSWNSASGPHNPTWATRSRNPRTWTPRTPNVPRSD